MTGHRMNLNLVAWSLALATLSVTLGVAQAEPESIIRSSSKIEMQDRYADVAAVGSQQTAIKKLLQLVKRYKNSSKEAPLLARLAQAYQESASIIFRIEHGKSHSHQQALRLKKHRQEMLNAIETVNYLLKKYPHYPDAGNVLYVRGKAYEEIGKIDFAKKDYLTVVREHSDHPKVISCYMALGEFSVDANKHQEALSYFKKVEEHPEDPHYPFALYKTAWSHYNLGNYPTALSYIERHIGFYTAREKMLQKEEGTLLASSEAAIRESSLNDACLFYADAYDKGVAGYNPNRALGYFRDLDQGPYLGKMLVRFAKLMRAKGREQDLVTWKNEVIDEENKRPEAMDVVVVTFDYFLSHQKYSRTVELAQDMIRLYKMERSGLSPEQTKDLKESHNQAREIILKTAQQLQSLTLKNKASQHVKKLSEPLVAMYQAFIQLVSPKDIRVAGVHYNLAETLFEIGDFEASTEHYGWLVQQWGSGPLKGKEIQLSLVNDKKTDLKQSLSDIKIKRVSARYRYLHAKKMIPQSLNVVAFSENSDRKLEPLVEEWIGWLDDYRKNHHKGLPADAIQTSDNFYFESNRTLYSNKHLERALKRLGDFANLSPGSRFAIPSAMLVLDTYVKSSNWERVVSLTTEYLKRKEWTEAKFKEKVYGLSADAHFKIIESSYKDDDKDRVVSLSEKFIAQFPKHSRLEDVYFIAGKAAFEIDLKEKSQNFYTLLITQYPKSANTAAAYLSRATQSEERFDFAQAHEDYLRYFSVYIVQPNREAKKVAELKRTILHLQWLAGNHALLEKQMKVSGFCDSELIEMCNRYQGVLALQNMPNGKISDATQKHAIQEAMNGPRDNRALWATVALTNPAPLAFPDRHLMVKIIAGNWDRLDKLTQSALIPFVSQNVIQAFQLNRKELNQFARVKASAKSIKRRVEMIREMEDVSTIAVKLPWARIRARVIHEVAGLYLDLSDQLANVEAPKGLNEAELSEYKDTVNKLVLPFEEKGNDIDRKAFEIAANFSIEDADFNEIANYFFQHNQSQAKSLKIGMSYSKYHNIDLSILEDFDDEDDWSALKKKAPSYYKAPGEFLKWSWAQAIQSKQFHTAAHLIREAKTKKLWTEDNLDFATAVQLGLSGARAEAIATLEGIRDRMPSGSRKNSMIVFEGAQLARSMAKEKVKELAEDLQKDVAGGMILGGVKSEDDAAWFSAGALWSGANLSSWNRSAMIQRLLTHPDSNVRDYGRKVQAEQTPPARKVASQGK